MLILNEFDGLMLVANRRPVDAADAPDDGSLPSLRWGVGGNAAMLAALAGALWLAAFACLCAAARLKRL